MWSLVYKFTTINFISKRLAPIYANLAKTLSANPNIIIAKMDATNEKIADLTIESYPTIKFYKK